VGIRADSEALAVHGSNRSFERAADDFPDSARGPAAARDSAVIFLIWSAGQE